MHGILVYGKHGGHSHSKESFLYPTSSNTSKIKVIGERECSDNITKMKRCIQYNQLAWEDNQVPHTYIRPQFSQSSSFIHLHPPILTPTTTLPPRNRFLQLNQHYLQSICLAVSYLKYVLILVLKKQKCTFPPLSLKKL